MNRVEEPLLKNLRAFIAFARNRVGDPHLAEDVVQESLVKALNARRRPAREEEVVAWFYRILRRSIIDLYRRRAVRHGALERFKRELPEAPSDADERLICECFRRLLPMIPEQYREVLERVDLEGGDPAQTAADLGVSRNNLTVRLHRARKQLREQISRACRACSRHGCLDCTCDSGAGE